MPNKGYLYELIGDSTMGWFYDRVSFSSLEGLTILDIEGVEKRSEEIDFTMSDGNVYRMYHEKDCCEYVELNDFEGDVDSLVGGVIVEFREDTNSEDDPPEYSESFTWTFYNIRTTKGDLWLRWLGESNGCYSESVDFIKLNAE